MPKMLWNKDKDCCIRSDKIVEINVLPSPYSNKNRYTVKG